jgi:hypothetical protein
LHEFERWSALDLLADIAGGKESSLSNAGNAMNAAS